MLKLTTDKHEASRGLSATAELLVVITCSYFNVFYCGIRVYILELCLSRCTYCLSRYNVHGHHNNAIEASQIGCMVTLGCKTYDPIAPSCCVMTPWSVYRAHPQFMLLCVSTFIALSTLIMFPFHRTRCH